ncbi:hypothetical protein VNO78_19634 [Psophocarpus tetragonolobus]|uniref:Uncharacterized protein n=1 Tax=Psophocarpus tetragonolobus TaxID=3891 RepID=A0AAN9XG03_PSOTE
MIGALEGLIRNRVCCYDYEMALAKKVVGSLKLQMEKGSYLWGTRVDGLTLLVIGAMGIKEASEVPTPCVALENGECDVNIYESCDSNLVVGKKKIGFATFATRIVHGLQLDALMMVLPALTLPPCLTDAAFVIMFLFGIVVAMGAIQYLLVHVARH